MYDVNLNWESLPHGGPSRIVLHILQCLVKKGDVNEFHTGCNLYGIHCKQTVKIITCMEFIVNRLSK